MIENFIKSYFHEGELVVRLPHGQTICIGAVTPENTPVMARVADSAAALRIARNPHLALGEAYMDGRLVMERGSIYDLLEVITRNFKYHFKRDVWTEAHRLLTQFAHLHTRLASRRNVAHHYDLSVDLYRAFLDSDLQYSCAYFPREGASLDEAQAAKKKLIATKLLLSPGDRVLDIGCGWGGMGLTLAEEYGADVTGVTLSVEQLNLARERAAKRGLSGKAKFELKDYRDVQGAFDRIVSVGMFEHVGLDQHQTYFDTVKRLLKPDGVALIHTIGRTTGPGATSPWTEKYIFPGGYIPALSEIVPRIERARLVITDIEVLRLHYAKTLRAWRERFLARRTEMAALYDERFCRMWEFYLAGSEASFRYGTSVVFQIQIAHRVDAAPIRRDYLVRGLGEGARTPSAA
jgi:cyclopropane-fatty-acyl-phospholipid synthase